MELTLTLLGINRSNYLESGTTRHCRIVTSCHKSRMCCHLCEYNYAMTYEIVSSDEEIACALHADIHVMRVGLYAVLEMGRFTILDCRLSVVMRRDFVSALQSFVSYCTVPGRKRK
jgi:hypothetical protein